MIDTSSRPPICIAIQTLPPLPKDRALKMLGQREGFKIGDKFFQMENDGYFEDQYMDLGAHAEHGEIVSCSMWDGNPDHEVMYLSRDPTDLDNKEVNNTEAFLLERFFEGFIMLNLINKPELITHNFKWLREFLYKRSVIRGVKPVLTLVHGPQFGPICSNVGKWGAPHYTQATLAKQLNIITNPDFEEEFPGTNRLLYEAAVDRNANFVKAYSIDYIMTTWLIAKRLNFIDTGYFSG